MIRMMAKGAGGLSQSRGAIPSRQSLAPLPSKNSGTVLMETVLILPLLLMLIMGVVQFARIWQTRLMVWHAAYNAARATLVYHPGEYREGGADGSFHERDGVAWAAAVQTLSRVSASTGGGGDYYMPVHGAVPNSPGIANQVRIVSDQSWEKNGMVRVTVEFQFQTIFKVLDFSSVFANKTPKPAVDATWNTLNAPTFTLTETCILPKLWNSGMFPGMHESDRAAVFGTR